MVAIRGVAMGLVFLAIIALLLLLGATAITAAILAVSTVLTRVFDVSVWEASVVLLATGTFVVWLFLRGPALDEHDLLLDELAPAPPPSMVMPPRLPRSMRPGNRRGR